MGDASVLDYGDSGLTIQYAMLDFVKRFPDKATTPPYILWNGLHVQTSDVFAIPHKGILRAEFLSAKGSIQQGFDLDLNGWLRLEAGEKVRLLRTWKDDLYEDVVEYPFFTRDGLLWVWNVYKMEYPGGQVVEEKWTENAGFWVEILSKFERIYHCSHGMATPPDFDSLVFKVGIHSR
jgi:hypothetical protein